MTGAPNESRRRGAVVVAVVAVAAPAMSACAPDGAPPAATAAETDATSDTRDVADDETSESATDTDRSATTEPTAGSTAGVAGSTTTTGPTGSTVGTTTTAPRPTTTSAAPRPAATTTVPARTPTTTAPRPTTTTMPTSTLSTAGARAGFDAVTAALRPGELSVVLDACPLDPAGDVLDALFAGIPSAGPSAAAPTESGVYELFDGSAVQIGCDRFSDDLADAVGVFAMVPPADLTAFVNAFANPDGLESVQVSVTQSAAHRGGRFVRICVVDLDDPTLDYCEIDWVGADLLVGVYVAGAASAGTDMAGFEAAVAARLERFLANLAG